MRAKSLDLKSEDLRIYSWLCHLLGDLGQAITSLWVSVTSFISTLGSVVFREVYVGSWYLKEEGKHSEHGQWHDQKSVEVGLCV